MNDDKTILPYANIERLMKTAGTKRIGEDAVIEMIKVLEDHCIKITKEAIILADHSGRVTIKEEDIRLATIRNK